MDRPAGKHERETAIILLVNISPPAYSHLPVYDILATLYKRLSPLEVTVPFRFLGRQGRISHFDLSFMTFGSSASIGAARMSENRSKRGHTHCAKRPSLNVRAFQAGGRAAAGEGVEAS